MDENSTIAKKYMQASMSCDIIGVVGEGGVNVLRFDTGYRGNDALAGFR